MLNYAESENEVIKQLQSFCEENKLVLYIYSVNGYFVNSLICSTLWTMFYSSVKYILQLHPMGNYSSLLSLYSTPVRQVMAIPPYKQSWADDFLKKNIFYFNSEWLKQPK